MIRKIKNLLYLIKDFIKYSYTQFEKYPFYKQSPYYDDYTERVKEYYKEEDSWK